MNNIDEMPPKCHDCPYWEACDYPYICPDTEPKPAENGNINAEIAENLQNRPADVFIWKQDALAAVSKHIGIKGNKAYIVDVVNAYAEIEMLPPAQLDFFITEKIDKAYDDGYKAGYLQGEFDARNEALAKDTNVPSKSALDHIHNVVRDDAYKRGYEQGKAEKAPAIPLAWIDNYIKTCEIFDLRANGIPAEKIIKTMLKIWGQETQGKKKGGDNGKT